MTNNQYRRAEELSPQIKEYERHVKEIRGLLNPEISTERWPPVLNKKMPVSLNADAGEMREEYFLKPEHFDAKQFIVDYLRNVEMKLWLLKKEFETL